MSGCVLFASGENFDVDLFLKTSPWRDSAVIFYRGEERKFLPIRPCSGFRIEISDPDEDKIDPQVLDAIKFLKENEEEIMRLVKFPGIDDLEINIGLFWLSDTVCYPIFLPPDFLFLAGKIGISVNLFIYAANDE